MRAVLAGIVIAATALLAGCGGGGDGPPPAAAGPQINSLAADDDVVWLSGRTAIRCDASGDGTTCAWSCDGGLIEGTGETVTWRAPDEPGTFEVRCRVEDARGRSVTESVQITCANATVEGRVVEVGTGLGQANVEVSIGGRSASTDADGRFAVPGVGGGDHTVTVLPPQTFVVLDSELSVSVEQPGSTVNLHDPVQVFDTGVAPPPHVPGGAPAGRDAEVSGR